MINGKDLLLTIFIIACQIYYEEVIGGHGQEAIQTGEESVERTISTSTLVY
jgi:hypothetical protein